VWGGVGRTEPSTGGQYIMPVQFLLERLNFTL